MEWLWYYGQKYTVGIQCAVIWVSIGNGQRTYTLKYQKNLKNADIRQLCFGFGKNIEGLRPQLKSQF